MSLARTLDRFPAPSWVGRLPAAHRRRRDRGGPGAGPCDGQTAAEELEAAGHRHTPVAADVSRAEDVNALFQRVRTEFGRLDILINKCRDQRRASAHRPHRGREGQAVRCEREQHVPLHAGCARLMIELRRGKIVNFASTAAFVSSSTVKEVAYDSSKGAVRQVTISSADE